MNYMKQQLLLSLKFLHVVLLTFFVGILPSQFLLAQENVEVNHWTPGDVIFDENKWTEVIVGDIPLVISVPHGGTFHDEQIPDRDCKDLGRVVKGVDSKTIETARAIENAFLKTYNKRPYLVISHLSRRKVDQNRAIEMASCGNALSEKAWFNFHLSIDTAIALAREQFGEVVYIDLHGHGHKNQRLELGYGLDKNQLINAFNNKEIEELTRKSSLVNYFKHREEGNLHSMLFGKYSFGSIIQRHGVKATPAMQDPHPINDEKFFAGGYNTRRYTSVDYPNVFGFQIECNYTGIRDTESNRATFGLAVAKSYMEYVENIN